MPSLAPLAATIRSQASATSRPPATAKPSMAAISGLSRRPLHDAREAAALHPRALARHEGLQVHARAEALAGAGEHADAQVGVGVELVQRGRHALGQRGVHGVAGVGPVEGDQQRAPAALGQNGVTRRSCGQPTVRTCRAQAYARHAPDRRPLRGPLHRPAHRRAAGGAAPAHDQVRRVGDGARRHGRLQAAELDDAAHGRSRRSPGGSSCASARARPRTGWRSAWRR